MNEKQLNLYQRINAIMAEKSYIKKTGNIGYGNNSYTAVLHDDVTTSLQPLLVKHGVVIIPNMINAEIMRYQVTTRKGDLVDRYETKATAELELINIDNPSERVKTTAVAHGFDSQDKSCGKAYSMAVKYCLLKLFMIASGDEEEDRVETSKVIDIEKSKLELQLVDLLKLHGMYNEKTIGFINQMGIDQLNEKINTYQTKEVES